MVTTGNYFHESVTQLLTINYNQFPFKSNLPNSVYYTPQVQTPKETPHTTSAVVKHLILSKFWVTYSNKSVQAYFEVKMHIFL